METIYLGGGCFWCVEAVFKKLKGVFSVQSGYMGGHVKNPCYREVCEGTTGHAEVIRIEFEPDSISLKELLSVFWKVHDPTTLNRQGADQGTQYRSAIFYTNDEQRATALSSRENPGNIWWEGKIVTEITEASVFYLAEEYHQDFYANHPGHPYCEFTIPPKLHKLETNFSHLIK
jgi:peptide-methionine (S)-S-oxide reductase